MQKIISVERNNVKTRSRSTLKGLGAAEARQRIEQLQEERLLQEYLAEFWDNRFDKTEINRVRLD